MVMVAPAEQEATATTSDDYLHAVCPYCTDQARELAHLGMRPRAVCGLDLRWEDENHDAAAPECPPCWAKPARCGQCGEQWS